MIHLPLSHWKTIEILKIVRFQRLNFTSKPKRYLLQTTKSWEKLIVLNKKKKKNKEEETRPKEEVTFLKRVKFVKMTSLLPLIVLLFSTIFYSYVYL